MNGSIRVHLHAAPLKHVLLSITGRENFAIRVHLHAAPLKLLGMAALLGATASWAIRVHLHAAPLKR